jgi:hypothetical protein
MKTKSPQQRWQDEKKAQGLCILCGQEPIAPGSTRLGASCAAKERKRHRTRTGGKAWKEGKRGRPPAIDTTAA